MAFFTNAQTIDLLLFNGVNFGGVQNHLPYIFSAVSLSSLSDFPKGNVSLGNFVFKKLFGVASKLVDMSVFRQVGVY